MRNFFRRKSSRETARDRLKILLISDRVNCSPEMIELIKVDIAKVISPLNADITAQGIIIVPAPKIGSASTNAINIAIKNGYSTFKPIIFNNINPISIIEKEINIIVKVINNLDVSISNFNNLL